MSKLWADYLIKKMAEMDSALGKRHTQIEFAEMLGIDRTNMSKWMKGETDPSNNMLDQIANVFGDEVYDVLGRPKPEHPNRIRDIKAKYETIPIEQREIFYQEFIEFWDEWFRKMGAERQDKPK